MKKIIIAPIISVIIGVLGLAIIYSPTDIGITLLGSVLMAGGVLGFIAYLVDRDSPKNQDG